MSGTVRRLSLLSLLLALTLIVGLQLSSTAPADLSIPSVSAGGGHTCALGGGGELSCWGDDSAGQASETPGGQFISVSAGGAHTCAIRADNELACWGDNSAGQLNGTPKGEFRSVSAGGTHTCAIRDDGALLCWGNDSAGQVSEAPESIDEHVYSGVGVGHENHEHQFLAVSSGGAHSCAIRDNGSLVCWGDNSAGQLSGTPKGEFRSVSAGGTHTCAIRTDGSLACWGDDSAGQVSETPAGEFVSVSSGGAHSCAVRTDGGLVCWGDNGHGQSHPLLSQGKLPRAVIGDPYSYTFATTPQVPAPQFLVSDGALPPGFSLSGGGELSGKPTVAGDFAFTVTASNEVIGPAEQSASLKVVGTPLVGVDTAQGVTSTSAVLSAKVNPRNLPAEAWFEYWPAASPQSATHTPAKTIAAAVTQEGLDATIAGLTPDTQYAYRVAASNELGPDPVQSSVLGLRTQPGPGIPPPVAGQSVNIDTAGGVVRVRCPGDSDFRTISAAQQIPVGCELDTDSGTVALTASRGSSGATQSAYFWGGTFEIDQSPGDEQDAVATLGGRLRCEKRAGAKGSSASRNFLRGRGGGRKLWGAGNGNFKTVGNYGSASVLGTTWVVIDRCDLTSVFEVKEGKVKIRDFIKGITAIITPGKRYIAKAPFLRLK